jgi:hypothetical protein
VVEAACAKRLLQRLDKSTLSGGQPIATLGQFDNHACAKLNYFFPLFLFHFNVDSCRVMINYLTEVGELSRVVSTEVGVGVGAGVGVGVDVGMGVGVGVGMGVGVGWKRRVRP